MFLFRNKTHLKIILKNPTLSAALEVDTNFIHLSSSDDVTSAEHGRVFGTILEGFIITPSKV